MMINDDENWWKTFRVTKSEKHSSFLFPRTPSPRAGCPINPRGGRFLIVCNGIFSKVFLWNFSDEETDVTFISSDWSADGHSQKARDGIVQSNDSESANNRSKWCLFIFTVHTDVELRNSELLNDALLFRTAMSAAISLQRLTHGIFRSQRRIKQSRRITYQMFSGICISGLGIFLLKSIR